MGFIEVRQTGAGALIAVNTDNIDSFTATDDHSTDVHARIKTTSGTVIYAMDTYNEIKNKIELAAIFAGKAS